jgi:branched-chain amino acid transport system permease protein
VVAERSGWWDAVKSNAPLPLIVLAFVLLGPVVESKAFNGYNTRIVMLVGINVILAVSLQLINGFSGQFSLGHAGFMMVGAYLAAYPALQFSKGMGAPRNTVGDPGATAWFYVSLAMVSAVGAGVVLALFLLVRGSRKLHRALPTTLLIALAVWVVADLSAGSTRAHPRAFFLWSHGIAASQKSFAWLMEHGVPVATKASGLVPAAARTPLTFVVLLIGSGLFAAAAGLIVGIPALRLRGDYLAIATLGMAEIIRILIQNSQPLGGALGLNLVPKYTTFAWLYSFALVTVVVVWRMAYSPRGRAIMAVREDEVAAAAVGIDPTAQKVLAFGTGAFFGGCAGALYVLFEGGVTPGTFRIERSIEIVVMVTLGGLGSISGAILAAIILTLLPEVLRPIKDYRMIIYSLTLVLMMLLRPQGLLGGRELWPRRRGPRPTARRDPVATEDRDDREAAGVATR